MTTDVFLDRHVFGKSKGSPVSCFCGLVGFVASLHGSVDHARSSLCLGSVHVAAMFVRCSYWLGKLLNQPDMYNGV